MSNEYLEYDRDGKIVLDSIYNEPDPRPYYSTLEKLDYVIPGEAAPIFRKVIAAQRAMAGSRALSVLDLGCSYGVNAAILKHGLSMDRLYARYAGEATGGLDRAALMAGDRDFYAGHVADPHLEVTGLDAAARAVDYAVSANILDGGLAADLEAAPPGAPEQAAIAGADLVISTGCVGYVTDRTLGAVMEAGEAAGARGGEGGPWMAHFVLRMFPPEPLDAMFDSHGYVTETLPGTFRQRRFASHEERDHVLDNLAALGIDPAGREADGWYHAEFRLSRPREDARALPLEALFRQ